MFFYNACTDTCINELQPKFVIKWKKFNLYTGKINSIYAQKSIIPTVQ